VIVSIAGNGSGRWDETSETLEASEIQVISRQFCISLVPIEFHDFFPSSETSAG
jgi:hypothetical protein